jgi:hypothetical protein
MIVQSSMDKKRTDLTRASPASPFAARASTIRHSRHGQQQIYASMLALVFAIRKRSVVPTSLLQSCNSVAASSREMRYIHLSTGKLFFGCRTHFSPANLPELLHAIVGSDISSFRAHGGRPRGIVSTWKQAVTQLFLRNAPPANHQKDNPFGSGSIQTNNILACPPFYY